MRRILVVAATERTDKRRIGQRELLETNLLNLSRGLRERLGIRLSAQLQQRLALAGIRSPQAPDMFFAAQCLTPLVGAFAGSFIKDNIFFWVFAFAAAGYVAPNFWLTEKVRRRKDRIRRSLPDAIDLLVICVDAGLGLDQALLRVIAELSLSHPDLQDELQRVHLEQKAGLPRLEAWRNLAKRQKIPEVTAFVNMLTQTERFGNPHCPGAHTLRCGPSLEETPAGRRSSRKDKGEDPLPAGFLHISLPVYRAPCAGGDQHRPHAGKCRQIGVHRAATAQKGVTREWILSASFALQLPYLP